MDSIIKTNKYVKDMTEGEPLYLLFEFAIPLLIGNLFQQTYTLADSIILGRYVGKISLGAVGSANSIIMLINSLTSGLSLGIGIIIAHFFGAKEDKKVKNTIGNSYYILPLAAFMMALLCFIFGGSFLSFLNTPKDSFPFAVIYIKTAAVGFVPVTFFHMVSATLRALGDSRTPLIFLIISCIINICFDIIFVIKFNLGIMGVGLATAGSQFLAAIMCFAYANYSNSYFRLHKEDFVFSKEIFFKVIKIGIPLALQNSFIALSLIALQRVIHGFGSDFVTSYTLVKRIELLVQHPFMSFGAAMATYTGQNMGAGKEERVRQGYVKAIICSSLFSLLIFILFQLFAPNIVRIFGNDPTVVKYAVRGLKLTSTFYAFLGCIHITRNLLNGAGDTRFSLINGMVECVSRVCLSKPITMIPQIGLNGIWYTSWITWSLNGIFCIIRYKCGKWKTIYLAKNQFQKIVIENQ